MSTISLKGHRASLAQSAAKTLFSPKEKGCMFITIFLICILIVSILYLIYQWWCNREKHIIEQTTEKFKRQSRY